MLDIQRISKTFNPGTVNEKKAITDLSLHLNKGEFVTVIGSNGAGKSTLFNAIAGSFYVDAGAITVGGHNMTFSARIQTGEADRPFISGPSEGDCPQYDHRGKSGTGSRKRQLVFPLDPEGPNSVSATGWPFWTWDLRIG